jgi:hypothetical protein
LGGLVFFIIQNPLNLEERKNCIGGGVWRVLGGLGEFFKSNLYCYNTFKVKNTLIISTYLSFSTKLFSQFLKASLFFPLNSSLQNPPLQTPKQSLRALFGGEGKGRLWGWKIKREIEKSSHFLKEYFFRE